MKRLAMLLAIFLCCATCFGSVAFAAETKSKLDSFEKEVGSTSSQTSNSSSFDAKEVATTGILEMLMSVFLSGLEQTGMESFSGLHKELKSEWSPALPTIRVEPSYQYLTDKVNGFSFKGEVGYLLVGADGEYTRYFEKSPQTSLDIWQAHFLLRTIFTRYFGINLALGAKGVHGVSTRTGFDFGMPFYIFFGPHFVVDVLPYMAAISGSNVYDLSGGLSYKYKFIGVRAAYRALFVGSQKLHGPRIGLFFQW